MTIIQHSLFSLYERFPEKSVEIKELYQKNESFKTLCEDYCRCTDALQHWEKSMEENAPARVQEYGALQRELEEEIIQRVNEST
jgi:hypothetical protein